MKIEKNCAGKANYVLEDDEDESDSEDDEDDDEDEVNDFSDDEAMKKKRMMKMK